tara:strand:- start:2671 stop:4449 length:1779 start_codon:yes stop_codon:yes gene_type:complete
MYQVIARKYRPQTFQQVVNQEHVKQTLINAITQKRIGHGYIFSGPRGTGKTTLARILAKSLNCEKGPTPEPCLECSSCQEITTGSSLDLTEIDAASNRRIDDIRELRENVRYRPVRDRYKVFIIDEAHQITSDAFNALLKTLEEPPEWVVFILCTTEPQQFPATIVSRCQTFPFRTVEVEQVVKHLHWLCQEEKITAENDALVAIALAGDGSIRDSLSTLDQAIASFGNQLKTQPVRDLLGAIPSEILDAITNALTESKPEKMLEVVDQLHREGRHLQNFCGQLVTYFRNLLVMKISGNDTRLVPSGDGDREKLSSHLDHFNQEDLTRYLAISLDLYRDLQHALHPRFRLEVGLLKLVHVGHLTSIEKILTQWNNPPTGMPADATEPPSSVAEHENSSADTSKENATTEHLPSVSIENRHDPNPESTALPTESLETPTDNLHATTDFTLNELQDSLVKIFKDEGDNFTADGLERAEFDYSSNGHLEIRPLRDDIATLQINLKAIEVKARAIGRRNMNVALGAVTDATEMTTTSSANLGAGTATDRSSNQSPSENIQPETEIEKRALSDPEVATFRNTLDGQVRDVRNLRSYS